MEGYQNDNQSAVTQKGGPCQQTVSDIGNVQLKNIDEDRQILWYDPRLNSSIANRFIARPYFSLKQFNVVQDLKEAEKTIFSNKQIKYIVVTSGTAQGFIKKLSETENVISIIIFTYHPDDAKWALSLDKVNKKICSKNDTGEMNGFYRVEREIARYMPVLHLHKPDYFFKIHDAMEFKLFKKAFQEYKQCSYDDVIDELAKLNSVRANLIKDILKRFQSNPLKAICHLYSTDLIYKPFNLACTTKKFDSVINTITYALNYIIDHRDRVYSRDEPLYRGIDREYLNIEDYQVNNKGFWPAFTSTSLELDVAVGFANGKKGGAIFRIKLTPELAKLHPNVELREWSEKKGDNAEAEVLLFPFFSFRVIKIEDGFQFNNKSYLLIDIEQNIEDMIISMNQYNYTADGNDNKNNIFEFQKFKNQQYVLNLYYTY